MWMWIGLWMLLLGVGEALVTLQTIRNLTDATDGYRGRIEEMGRVGVGVDVVVGGTRRGGGGVGQAVLDMGAREKEREIGGGGGDGDEDEDEDEGEIEDVSSFCFWFLKSSWI